MSSWPAWDQYVQEYCCCAIHTAWQFSRESKPGDRLDFWLWKSCKKSHSGKRLVAYNVWQVRLLFLSLHSRYKTSVYNWTSTSGWLIMWQTRGRSKPCYLIMRPHASGSVEHESHMLFYNEVKLIIVESPCKRLLITERMEVGLQQRYL